MDYSLPFRKISGDISVEEQQFSIEYKEVFVPYIKNNQLEEATLFFEKNYKSILGQFDISGLIIQNFQNTEEYIKFTKFILKYRLETSISFIINEINRTEEELLIIFSLFKSNLIKNYISLYFRDIFKCLNNKKYFNLLKKIILYSIYNEPKSYTNKLIFAFIFKYDLQELYEDILIKYLFNKKNDDFFFYFCVHRYDGDYIRDVLSYNEDNFKFSDNIDKFILKHIDSLILFKNISYDINYKKIQLIHYFFKYEIFIEYAKNHVSSFENILKYNDKLSEEYKCNELISIFEKIKLKNQMNHF